MQDSLFCPICQEKFKNSHTQNNIPLPLQHSRYSYFERTCTAPNHVVLFYVDKQSLQVDYIVFSIYPNYSVYVEVNFLDKETHIYVYFSHLTQEIKLPKIIEPDFPELTKVKELINLYLTFS